MGLVKELSKHRQRAISQYENDPKLKPDKLMKALRLEQTYSAKNCLEFAQSLQPFSISADTLDSKRDSLACRNGILYSEFGFLAPPDQQELVTKCLSANYDEQAISPRW